jgi:hypothetical protein
MNYNYNITTDISSAKVDIDRLSTEIVNSSISTVLTRLDVTGNTLTIRYSSEISVGDKASLDAIVLAHSGEAIPEETTPTLEVDGQGRQIVRRATSQKGWHYSAIISEVKSSTLGTYNKDYLGNDLNEVTIRLFDINDVEITDQAIADTSCVKTVVTVKPDYDFEVIEGDLYQHTRPTEDIRLWTLAGIPELGPSYVKVFANGVNLRFMSPDDHIESDGRSSKFMIKDIEGVPFNANQFQFIIKHSEGFKHELMILLELYKQ